MYYDSDAEYLEKRKDATLPARVSRANIPQVRVEPREQRTTSISPIHALPYEDMITRILTNRKKRFRILTTPPGRGSSEPCAASLASMARYPCKDRPHSLGTACTSNILYDDKKSLLT
ncbi:hypothetical protein P3342_002076 [Pyrenophora teres f. teres]|nr:hypothetical protein P3342_002076 [Pyrenophora teres f. teres]